MNNTIKLVKHAAMCLIGLSLFVACEDELEDKTTNDWDASYVWTVADMAEGVLNKAYEKIPKAPDAYDDNYLDAATDNALTSAYGSMCYNLGAGAMTSKNNPLGIWKNTYNNFQYIHQFLMNGLREDVIYVRGSEEENQAYKQRLEGEAYFLRAYWGYRLLQVYGGKTDDGRALGYPIVTSFLTTEEMEHADLPRNTYEECALQIMEDCDKAASLLPLEYSGGDNIVGVTQVGRGSGLAAMALKAQVALYAASPAYQPASIVVLNGMGDYTVVDNVAYKQKWARAAIIADDCIKTNGFGGVYGLQSSDLADAPSSTPSEFILRAYFNNNSLEKRHFAPYYFGKARTVPSQNLVDAFPASNGFPITDPRSNYDNQNPYFDRDHRFELNVYHHGQTYGTSDLVIDVTPSGVFGPLFSETASRTGYYLAKGISKSYDMLDVDAAKNAVHYYPLLRKAQIYLAYAEAANEAWGPQVTADGMTMTAYDVIKQLRQVSGGITNTVYLDEMASDAANFRTLIHNERRIELAFESSRYWDLRRWLSPLDVSVRGVSVTSDESGSLSYAYNEVEARKYNALRYYYAPLPYDEILTMPSMVNNLGWASN